MPELAEVEFFRTRWACGIGAPVVSILLHDEKRIFRGTDVEGMRRSMRGARLIDSASHGKQMAFRFSGGLWLGIHLGMTGELRVEPHCYAPGRHDHLVLLQARRALVFEDARQFGRVLFFRGEDTPAWWSHLPPTIDSTRFSLPYLDTYLRRHRKLPLKAALLDQSMFPGIGNWMADEILWQARLDPRRPCGALNEAQARELWKKSKFVVRRALATVAKKPGERGFGDPPSGWLFHERWSRGGTCPRDGSPLRRATVGGRTTAWCPRCQG